MDGLPDPDWYLDNVLVHASPGFPVRAPDGAAAHWRAWWETQARADDPAVALARAQGFVATLDQLHALGWERHDDRRELRRRTWWTIGRGARTPVAVNADDANAHLVRRRRHALQASAAVLAQPDHVVSGRSAAILHGLPTLSVPRLAELTARDKTLGRRDRAHVFGATLPTCDVSDWFGAPVATAARTVVDLARHDRRDGLMAGDAALREGFVGIAELDRVVADATGWPGVRAAREVLALTDPRAESPLESLVRLALHDDGFPAPRPQVVIDDPQRGSRYRVDLLFEDARLILEADGREKYTDNDGRWKEKQRETRLRALGYRVERVLWDDVVRFWDETSRRLRRLLAAPVPLPRW